MVNLALLIPGTFLIAAGGILYEIFLGALGSYIFGDSVKIFSLTAGVYMFSMGIGAFSIRHKTPKPLQKLMVIETVMVFLHTLGPLLIWFFFIAGAGAGIAFWTVLTLSGILVGTEIPLVLGLTRETEGSSDARINQVLAADYFGALIASLLFGFYLLPQIGLIGSASTAALFECLGMLCLIFAMPKRKAKLAIALFAGLAVACIVLFSVSEKLQRKLETAFFQAIQPGIAVIKSEWTGFSHVSVIEYTAHTGHREIALVLDRQFQWSTGEDLAHYHEALTVPAVESFKESNQGRIPQKVLILGGGDAFAAHTLRSLYNIPSVTIVDIDPRISELALEVPQWKHSGGDAVLDPQVHVIHDDAFGHVRRMPSDEIYDLVIFDLPDPRSAALARFFTPFFIKALSVHMSPHAVITIQASSQPQQSLGKLRYVCSLMHLLRDSGYEASPLIGDVSDYFIVASRPPLQFPAPGKNLPGVEFKNSSLIAQYRVDPIGYFESPQCHDEVVNQLLAPKLLDF